jgi:hypothetical protein
MTTLDGREVVASRLRDGPEADRATLAWTLDRLASRKRAVSRDNYRDSVLRRREAMPFMPIHPPDHATKTTTPRPGFEW